MLPALANQDPQDSNGHDVEDIAMKRLLSTTLLEKLQSRDQEDSEGTVEKVRGGDDTTRPREKN